MTPEKSTTNLLADAMNQISALVRGEVDLARAEINQNLSRAGVALGLIVGALVAALTALNVLAAAIVAGLTEAGLHGGWAALIVGVVFAIIAFVMLKKGTDDLKLNSLAPSRTATNVKRDAMTVKEVYND